MNTAITQWREQFREYEMLGNVITLRILRKKQHADFADVRSYRSKRSAYICKTCVQIKKIIP